MPAPTYDFLRTPDFVGGALLVGFALSLVGSFAARLVDWGRQRATSDRAASRERTATAPTDLAIQASVNDVVYLSLPGESARLRTRATFRCVVAMLAVGHAFLLLVLSGDGPTDWATARPAPALLYMALMTAAGTAQSLLGFRDDLHASRADRAITRARELRARPVADG